MATQKLKFVLGRVGNIVGKGENAGYQHFLLFPQCFLSLFFSRDVKSGLCGNGLKQVGHRISLVCGSNFSGDKHQDTIPKGKKTLHLDQGLTKQNKTKAHRCHCIWLKSINKNESICRQQIKIIAPNLKYAKGG